jgi:UDPglucose 6-dehydrogenase
MKIAVVGTGYVGLVLGACLAENGNTVACVDKDAEKVATLRAGRIPFYEPGLEEMVRRNHADERLSFTTELPAAVRLRSCSLPWARLRAKTARPI